MKKQVINGDTAYVDDKLEGFSIRMQASTNVEFFGSSEDGRVFVQFKSGNTYIYSGVPVETRKAMEAADSIGSFVAELIVKPNTYPSIKYGERLVNYETVTDEAGNDVW